MRVNTNIFWILTVFFVLSDTAYTIWALIAYGRVEWVGTVGIALTAILSVFIGFYLYRSYKAQGGELPEDRQDASIDDGDPEMGFFSPWSWWPVILGGTAALGFAGLAVGYWMTIIAGAFFLIAITGWVYEYYRGLFAR
ncbi:cytochrome c oxidase subunit 4 [uncultured Amnibacterium sp.]|uniref:cytochrome c oxidase subunit 4 n=1 Tax=uncultured Amnibacterium sp. TaxID=1631851 RepID=UPI0035C9692E